MLRYILDRFEGSAAVLENEEGKTLDLPAGILDGWSEGDCVIIITADEGLFEVARVGSGGLLLRRGFDYYAVPFIDELELSEGDRLHIFADGSETAHRREIIDDIAEKIFEQG